MAIAKATDTSLGVPPYGSPNETGRPKDVSTLREWATSCRACPLWEHATQTVFGEGAENAGIFLVGEQPGDQEDKAGKPFVGPAGRVLNECLEAAGVDRAAVYITNAVKHFKWVQSGVRRLHQKPNRREVLACKPWLEAELAVVKPSVVVCLGATAAQALLGPDFRLTKHRGEILSLGNDAKLIATLHPSALLRMPDAIAREEARRGFIQDLKLASSLLSG